MSRRHQQPIFERLAVGAGVDTTEFRVAGLTPVDASDILGSVTQSGSDITWTLDADTISNTPSTAAYVQRAVTDVFGSVSDVDLLNVARVILRVGVLAPIADIHVGIALVTSDDTRGLAVRLAAVAGDWQVQHSVNTASSWGAWTGGTSDAATQGVVGQHGGRAAAATQTRWNAAAVDAVYTPVATAGAPTVPVTVNIGNDLTHVRIFAGWIAGGGGGAPAVISVRASHFLLKLLTTATVARHFAP